VGLAGPDCACIWGDAQDRATSPLLDVLDPQLGKLADLTPAPSPPTTEMVEVKALDT
jgi:hypothetical protein